MRSPIAPSELSADQRRVEVARILAAGILRLRRLRFQPRNAANNSPAERLDVRGKTVLSVRNGLTAREAK